MSVSTSQSAPLWARLKQHNDPQARQDLIVLYLPLVRHVAGKVAAKLPPSVEYADLVSYGTFGLIDAIEKFDLDKAVKFETYAVARVRGAIIDELRTIDWVPRSIRAKAKTLDRTTERLEAEHGRTPTSQEMATALDLSDDELTELVSGATVTSIAALEETTHDTDGDSLSYLDTVSDPTASDPHALQENAELCQLMSTLVSGMGERERIILALYCVEGLTLAQIGEVLGVTESRVCQMHTKAIAGLRDLMQERGGGLAVLT